MGQGKLRVEQTGAVGWMLLDNPERRNAMTGAMWPPIPEAMRRFDAAPETRWVGLCARGRGLGGWGRVSEWRCQRA